MRAAAIDEIAPHKIIGGSMTWHPVRRELGVRAFGVNAYTASSPGDRVVEQHTESSQQQEAYLVVSGAAAFELGEDRVDAPAGTLVYVRDADIVRGAVATEPGTTVVAFGAPVGEPYRPPVWEHDFAAQEPYDAGRFDEAYEIAAAGLEEFPESPRLHYNLACYANRAGQEQVALDHLRRAVELDRPQVTAWAADDEDVASIREPAGIAPG